jgi:hypothetical protein
MKNFSFAKGDIRRITLFGLILSCFFVNLAILSYYL